VIFGTLRPYSCNGSLEYDETSQQEEQLSSSGSNSDLAVRCAHLKMALMV
jgi:hypothetical protein